MKFRHVLNVLGCCASFFCSAAWAESKSGTPSTVAVASDYFCEKTGLYMSCAPEKGEPAASFTDGFMSWTPEKGYGRGMEDSAILNGIALVGLTARCDPATIIPAERVAQGLLNLATVHGVKGFVARGICPEDGRSVCTLTSRDQITHFVHGLWSYYHWSRAKEETKAQIRTAFAELADRLPARSPTLLPCRRGPVADQRSVIALNSMSQFVNIHQISKSIYLK